MSSTPLVVSHPDNVAVEAVCLGLYIVISLFAVALVIGRRSYQLFCCCYCCTRGASRDPSPPSSSATTKEAKSHKQLLDTIIVSMSLFLVYRVASSAVRLTAHIVRSPTTDLSQEPIEQVATILLILGYPFYTFIFSMLLWLWMKLGLVFFEGSKRTLKCIEWTVRLVLVSTLVLICAYFCVILIFQLVPAWKYGANRSLYITIAQVVGVLFLLEMVKLTLLATVLGVRISLLVCQTMGKEAALAQQRNTLTKLGVSVGVFVVAMNMRVVGVASVFLTWSYWIMSLFLIALPEILCFGTLIFVLWPFSIVCCKKRILAPDQMQVSKSSTKISAPSSSSSLENQKNELEGRVETAVAVSPLESVSNVVESPSAGASSVQDQIIIIPAAANADGSASVAAPTNVSDVITVQ